jgi:hypothetical protein
MERPALAPEVGEITRLYTALRYEPTSAEDRLLAALRREVRAFRP